jgi:hypothetical protein
VVANALGSGGHWKVGIELRPMTGSRYPPGYLALPGRLVSAHATSSGPSAWSERPLRPSAPWHTGGTPQTDHWQRTASVRMRAKRAPVRPVPRARQRSWIRASIRDQGSPGEKLIMSSQVIRELFHANGILTRSLYSKPTLRDHTGSVCSHTLWVPTERKRGSINARNRLVGSRRTIDLALRLSCRICVSW